MLDTILKEHSNHDIIQKLQIDAASSALEEFQYGIRQRAKHWANNGRRPGMMFPMVKKGDSLCFFNRLVTVMATRRSRNQVIQEAIQEAKIDQKPSYFDSMTFPDWKAQKRAQELVDLGASALSIWMEDQATRKNQLRWWEKYQQLKNSSTKWLQWRFQNRAMSKTYGALNKIRSCDRW